MKSLSLHSPENIASPEIPGGQEQRQLLHEWNNTRTDYPKDKCIHQLFEAQVARTPEAIALIFDERRLTYRELNSRANQLAHYLRSLGVGPDVLVGLCIERSVEMIVGILGILKAGGAYVPLDPAYPRERLAFMLEDSQAHILLTQQKLLARVGTHNTRVVCLDTDWNRIAQETWSNPTLGAAPDNLSYVIYTSGSTGQPKGVMIPHRGLTNYLSWCTEAYEVANGCGALLHSSLAFDLTITSLFPPLLVGKSVFLLPEDGGIETLAEALLRRENYSLLKITPAHLRVLSELLPANKIAGRVRALVIGGEALDQESLSFWRKNAAATRLINEYGPTETVVGCSVYEVAAEDPVSGPVPIGRPIANTQLYVLDENREPVRSGVIGELYVGGDGVARGYLNLPELTAECFIANPFSKEPNARMYRTGDLARYLPAGELEYVGRIDNQVKIRGYRIELGEIEAVLSRHPSIKECVVIAREDQPDDKRLVAYLVVDPTSKSDIVELRDFLKQKLPAHMVPSAFVELDELPITLNGKIDRRALPAPPSTLSHSAEEEDEFGCRDDVELKLISIWEKILRVQSIRVDDNFFDLGGHSLQAVRMFSEVEKTFLKSIPFATLFQAATIEELAAILRQDGWSAPESSIVAIQPNGTRPPFFCVHAKGGNVLFYRDLARSLGQDQPFYGIQPRRVGGRQAAHTSVEEMAEYYIREMQSVQPSGPYFLGGASFGGIAAFEMARQLHAQGQKVSMVALLDGGTPDYPKLLPGTTVIHSGIRHVVERLQHHLRKLQPLNFQGRVEYVWDRTKKFGNGLRRTALYNYRRAGGKLYKRLHRPLPPNFIQVENDILEAKAKYIPQVYAGKLTIFRASTQPSGIDPDPTLGWTGLAAGGLEIHEVPGDHNSIIMEPDVRGLAKELSQCLERAPMDAAARQAASVGSTQVLAASAKAG